MNVTIDGAAAIDSIRRTLEAAENAGDAEAAVGLLADDAVAMVPDLPVQQGKEACAALMREIMPALIEEFDRRIAYTSAEVQLLADGLAFDRGTFAFTIVSRAGGETAEVTGKYLWILRRAAAGPWKIARLIVSRDQEFGEGEEC